MKERLTPDTQYRERIDLEATLAARGTRKLKRGTVTQTWKKSLEAAGGSGSFASFSEEGKESESEELEMDNVMDVPSGDTDSKKAKATNHTTAAVDDADKQLPAPRNKLIRNKGDPVAVKQAKERAKHGEASIAIRNWLFPAQKPKMTGLPKMSLKRFSDLSPPVVLNRETFQNAAVALSKDPKLAAVIERVGVETLEINCGNVTAQTEATLFDRCVRAITFTMVSVDAGNVRVS